MANRDNATEKGGMHGRKDLESEELQRDTEEVRRAQREQGAHSISDAETGEEGIQRKGVGGYGADPDAVDPRSRQAPPLQDKGPSRE